MKHLLSQYAEQIWGWILATLGGGGGVLMLKWLFNRYEEHREMVKKVEALDGKMIEVRMQVAELDKDLRSKWRDYVDLKAEVVEVRTKVEDAADTLHKLERAMANLDVVSGEVKMMSKIIAELPTMLNNLRQ